MAEPTFFEHLGVYSDLVQYTARTRGRKTEPRSPELRQRICDLLQVDDFISEPRDFRVESTWTNDGLRCEEVSWPVGYGPRTHSWVLRPDDSKKLPAIVALHGHDGVKWYGKEKIADGPVPPSDSIRELRAQLYEGNAYANALAKEGFVVLAHDVFLWGSRRFRFESMPESIHEQVEIWANSKSGSNPDTERRYNFAAFQHEHLVAKYCTVIGTSIPALVNYEDRIAASYLQSRPDVDPIRIGSIGLSGGGCRAALLAATCDYIAASVIVGMMSTYEHLLDRHVTLHTWMFFPPGLASFADWPDLAATCAPTPLLVQYDRDDELFPLEGMKKADQEIRARYARSGHPESYQGRFYPGRHKFDRAMQADAFAWLKDKLCT